MSSGDDSNGGKTTRLADAMPIITAWVASLREAFGDEMMDDLIRRGRSGEAVFYASENGITFGTKLPVSENTWRCEGLMDRHVCDRCCGSCVGTKDSCARA